MRIQHNISAMNSYRNYTANANSLSKNLEKLSSGYKINRAGDDAAGLAISEKMRAQISGLKQAANNVKDGISLVKTAEGALQEVQDMMTRMVTLATQSANGTYDNEVDRNNLQKEVEALTTEIDRITDSSNFNGTKLLDGSMGAAAELTTKEGTAATITFNLEGMSLTAANDTLSVGGVKVLTATAATADASKVNAESAVTIGGVEYDVNLKGNTLTLTAKDAGATTLSADNFTLEASAGTAATTTTPTLKDGTNASVKVDFTGKNGKNVIGASITIGEKKYEFYEEGTTAPTGDNVVAVAVAKDADDEGIAAAMQAAAGLGADAVDGAVLTVNAADATVPKTAQVGKGLTLQIGDTADNHNQLQVRVGDMHTKALGIDADSINVKTQDEAAKAIDKIKKAINVVSSTRGDLGAIQNRLEHTTNNLSIMAENIQDAESTIRDVDIADEMTTYTKNNILLQSAQAMLAQANQMPQGVLQLLQ